MKKLRKKGEEDIKMKTKLLWIVNTIFPYPAEKLGIKKTVFGGWMNALANGIVENEDINLAIATVYNGRDIKEYSDGKIMYYLIPGAPAVKYNKKLEEYWKNINERFSPDLVHIHGTEYTHGLAFVNACPEVKNIVSIQGLVSVYAEVYNANISNMDIIKNITLRDIIKRDTLFTQKKNFIQRGKYEVELIKKANAITGRTIWDYSNSKAINPSAKYYASNRILREPFYNNKKWSIDTMCKHTIFCSQAGYPIKGFHYAVKAVAILKETYPDIKLIVGGNNIIEANGIKKKIKLTGYGKYVKKLIEKYKLENNIEFKGCLNEKQMVEELQKANVFVQSSSIENSPNSLGEAMLMGTPCIASFVGGTMDMLEHEKEGYLYTYTEPAILAEYINRIFKDDELAKKFSENAIKKANVTHDKSKIIDENMYMYTNILNK